MVCVMIMFYLTLCHFLTSFQTLQYQRERKCVQFKFRSNNVYFKVIGDSKLPLGFSEQSTIGCKAGEDDEIWAASNTSLISSLLIFVIIFTVTPKKKKPPTLTQCLVKTLL